MDFNDFFDDNIEEGRCPLNEERRDLLNEDEKAEDLREQSYSFEKYRKKIERLLMEQMELEQPIISKKPHFTPYSVDRKRVNSKEYHDKFEKLPVNHEVQQALYKEAGRLLEFVDGQEEERMLAVNARTGELLVDNFDRKGSIRGTAFTNAEAKKLDKCKDGIVLMHNHSLNGRPSAQDMLTYLKEERVRLSLILCHNGMVYGIYGVRPEFKETYKQFLSIEKLRTNDLDEAKRLTTTQMYLLNEKLGDKHKLFWVRRL
jgi:hypothetical protein